MSNVYFHWFLKADADINILDKSLMFYVDMKNSLSFWIIQN